LAVPREYSKYAKTLIGKENLFYIAFFYQVSDMGQAEILLTKTVDDIPVLASEEYSEFCPNICTLDQICKLHGTSKKMAVVLVNLGVYVKVGHNKYHRDKSTTNYIEYQRKLQKGDSSYNEAKLKQKMEQAKALEIANLARMKKLVNAEETQRLIEREYAELKKRLNNLVFRLPPILEDKNAADIFEIAKGEMDECLTGFVTPNISAVNSTEREESPVAASRVKNVRVGRQKKGSQLKNKRRTRTVANKKNTVS
jgi:uncharacterized protein YecE (DUF72 family)